MPCASGDKYFYNNSLVSVIYPADIYNINIMYKISMKQLCTLLKSRSMKIRCCKSTEYGHKTCVCILSENLRTMIVFDIVSFIMHTHPVDGE